MKRTTWKPVLETYSEWDNSRKLYASSLNENLHFSNNSYNSLVSSRSNYVYQYNRPATYDYRDFSENSYINLRRNSNKFCARSSYSSKPYINGSHIEYQRTENLKQLEEEFHVTEIKRIAWKPLLETYSECDNSRKFCASRLNENLHVSNNSYNSLVSSRSNYVYQYKRPARYHNRSLSKNSYIKRVNSNKVCTRSSYSSKSHIKGSKNFYQRKRPYTNYYGGFRRCTKYVDGTSGLYDGSGYYSVVGTSSSPERPWDGRGRERESPKIPRDYGNFNHRKMHSVIRSLYRSYVRKESYFNKNRPRVSKEELDDELDRYMCDVKCATPQTKDDIDSFLEEYMLETEKSLSQYDPLEAFI